MRMVQKYGGSSLGNGAKIRQAAGKIAALYEKGHQMVVVVSARGDTTDILLEKVAELTENPSLRELDACLATGEQVSAAMMVMALEERNVPAVSLNGWQAGIITDETYGNADILQVDTRRILAELSRDQVVVVTGFQGISGRGNLTTLGRGGSDTTAVALADALQADRCQIFTDVDGVYDRDPRKDKDAKKFTSISYDRMLALIAGGAQVLHDKSVILAKKKAIQVEVLSAFSAVPGTLVGPFPTF